MKKCNIHYIGGDYIYFQMSISVAQLIAYLENIPNLGILPYLSHFSEVFKRILLIKSFEG